MDTYAYAAGVADGTTITRVSTKRNLWNNTLINQFQHGYDAFGNITSVYDAVTLKRVNYTYDDQRQLRTATHIDNGTTTRTEKYTYDNVGNIKTFNNGTTTHTYTYGDTNWKDLLTAVDGHPFSYDSAGNPTRYYNGANYTMTWVEGRRLQSVTTTEGKYTYEYNADGQRTKKTNPDGSYIEYYVMDGVTVGESHFSKTGSKTLGIRYTFDENNSVIGITTGGQNYYFVKNLQGDVLAVYRASDNVVVAQYTYDSWGNVVHATGSLALTNPFRYRSYYYDEETGFYYVSSRYYDPVIGRWINADDTAYLGADGTPLSYNLFAYCVNNPVDRTDINGNWSGWAIAGVIVGTVLCVAAVTVLTCGVGTATLAGAVAVGAAKGALVGAAVGTAAGAGIGYAATGTLEGAAIGAAIGFGAGAVVGAVAGGACGGSNYIKASSFLKSNGVDPSDVLPTYKGTPKVKTLKTDTTVYRTWGGSSGKYGHWVSPKNYGSNARSMLSLPDGNTCENISSFLLREGTTILSGKAAPLFGQAGGGIQWWVGHLS